MLQLAVAFGFTTFFPATFGFSPSALPWALPIGQKQMLQGNARIGASYSQVQQIVFRHSWPPHPLSILQLEPPLPVLQSTTPPAKLQRFVTPYSVPPPPPPLEILLTLRLRAAISSVILLMDGD